MSPAFSSAEAMPDGKPKRERSLPKKARKKPRLKPAAEEKPASLSWWDDSWHWVGLGLCGLVTPFTFVSLTTPSWTGEAGVWLSDALYQGAGISALLLPALSGSLGLHLLLPRSKRPLQLSWAPTLFWLDLVWLAQRMGHQGGALGASWDGLVVAAVGPLGSWMGSALGLAATSLFICRVPIGQVTRQLAHHLVGGLERGGRWLGELRQQLRERAAPRPMEVSLEESLEVLPPARPPQFLSVESTQAPSPPAPVPAPVPAAADKPRPPKAVVRTPEPPVLAVEEIPLPPAIVEEVCFSPVPPPQDTEESLEELLPEDSLAEESLGPVCEEVEAEAEPEPSLEEEEELPLEPEPLADAQEIEIPAADEAQIFVDPDGQMRLFPDTTPKPKAITYRLPPLSLLNELPLSSQRPQVEDKSQVLLDSLASFGVQASLLAIVQGPTVTRYELQPARGVKVNRFTSLTNDIALALAAKAVRIEAPIPGKSAIGIEIPNEVTEMVVLREILASPRFRKSTGMSIALGKDLSGTPTFAALQKMPHLLVAGTTGSGKSVCVNALIMSLLYRFTPRELQLLMIDPKQVELSIYEGVPHLISLAKGASDSKSEGAIICDPKRAAMALNQVVELMEHRYSLFAQARVRNLDEYNEAAEDRLPWVVVIIDELADLMMVASKSVETSICRIAQKARAAGIHLVLATQRPSADVITGLIKVNVPSRIAFAVSSQVDSRVILDTGGAEQLLGKGDMLFCPVDASDPRRLQGCYVTNEEILRVVEWWRAQGSPDNLIQLQVGEQAEEAAEDEEGDGDDGLVEQAVAVILRRQQASASLLQTELKVGYARARRLIYLMEKKGYIGPAEGSKPRKILVTAPP